MTLLARIDHPSDRTSVRAARATATACRFLRDHDGSRPDDEARGLAAAREAYLGSLEAGMEDSNDDRVLLLRYLLDSDASTDDEVKELADDSPRFGMDPFTLEAVRVASPAKALKIIEDPSTEYHLRRAGVAAVHARALADAGRISDARALLPQIEAEEMRWRPLLRRFSAKAVSAYIEERARR